MSTLSESDVWVIDECLRAITDGPFILDWEFHSVIGLDRNRVAEIAEAWPNEGTSNDVLLNVCKWAEISLSQLLSLNHKSRDQS